MLRYELIIIILVFNTRYPIFSDHIGLPDFKQDDPPIIILVFDN